jgi:hypothetical protein
MTGKPLIILIALSDLHHAVLFGRESVSFFHREMTRPVGLAPLMI